MLGANGPLDPLLEQDAALLQVESPMAQNQTDAAQAAWSRAPQMLDAVAADARAAAYENVLNAVRIAPDRGDTAAATRLFAAAEQSLDGSAPMPRLRGLHAQLVAPVNALARPH